MAFEAQVAPYSFEEFPDEFRTYTFGPYAAADLSEVILPVALLDRECDIEHISARADTAGNAIAISFYYAAPGTDITSATSIGSGDADELTANTVFQIDNLSGANGIAAGSILGIGGASGLTTLAQLMVTVRTRTTRPRTSDAGQKV